MQVIDGKIIVPLDRVPQGILNDQLGGDIASLLNVEYAQIEKYYEAYKNGISPYQSYTADKSAVKFRNIKVLINKEARFMFSVTPDFNVNAVTNADDLTDEDKRKIDAMQNLVDAVVKKNCIGRKLVQAAKDCFVGKRVGWVVNFNDNTGIRVLFFKSVNFYAEYEEGDSTSLKRFVYYVYVNKAYNTVNKRVFVKDYQLGEDGLCHITETLYDGAGRVVEEPTVYDTDFDYLPCGVIVNEGMIGEEDGISEVEDLSELEKLFSRLSNWDVDAERADMNPVKYTVDIDPVSTANLSHGAGAYWDLQHDLAVEDPHPAVGILSPTMNHTTALKETLDRTKQAMNELVQVPNVSPDKISGAVASYKGLRALYWDMIIRCNEKMQTWGSELEKIVRTIIDGAIMNPKAAQKYIEDALQVARYKVEVIANYAIQDDEESEKQIDMQEVQLNIMSRRSYNKKWRDMTDKKWQEELAQIAEENAALESSSGFTPPVEDIVM